MVLSLFWRCLACTENTDRPISLCEGNQQEPIVGRVTDYDFSFFLVRMPLVVKDECQGIKENRCGFFETDTVFSDVVSGLGVVLFEPQSH
jgi:hypothetical protein